jgi:hypothetical protein
MSDKKPKAKKGTGMSVPVHMPAELQEKIESAAGQVRLSKQDVMRLAIERGLDVLITQLTTVPAAKVAA